MLSHDQIWAAIDHLAERHGLSTSGLARRAGLDATTFNPSKRRGPDGRDRWPSTESIAKVLGALGTGLEEFTRLVEERPRTVPLVGLAQAGRGRVFNEDGVPEEVCERIDPPDGTAGPGRFAIEVTGDSMLPLYRAGDLLIVDPAVPVRNGDRVVVRTRGGEVMAKEMRRRTAKQVELASLNPEHEDRVVPAAEIDWIARVMWARQ